MATETDPTTSDQSTDVDPQTVDQATPDVVAEAAEAVAAPATVTVTTGKLSARALIEEFEAAQLKSDLPEIYVGDTVKVGVRIREGNKERVQPYEGVVIAKRHGGLNQTITVRRIFQGIGVERVFMLHSPQVASVKVERRGKVRRAKLFYLRDRVGKATRVKQRFDR
ncbi:50S ribosomal protein L19 [Cyanobium gracile UHCC 0139]|uniref:Large ribosomal subunit protein bL19 n=1 Tax=Cyanobium gracile UHCC 0139 TaxID=3110308 RepID=A0ABU5RWT7_9CYAN|nr:50S ribosomal protein L19 [Cyanobium gracile]MEA5392250.1 50S ribosomal protein L19 [Cyanobium gracile UHCC 0139]